ERIVLDEARVARLVRPTAEARRMKNMQLGEHPLYLDAFDFFGPFLQHLAANLNQTLSHFEFDTAENPFAGRQLSKVAALESASGRSSGSSSSVLPPSPFPPAPIDRAGRFASRTASVPPAPSRWFAASSLTAALICRGMHLWAGRNTF